MSRRCPWCDEHPETSTNSGHGYAEHEMTLGCFNRDCPVKPKLKGRYNTMMPNTPSQEDVEANLRSRWNSELVRKC